MISEDSMRQKYTKIHVFRACIRPLARKYTKIHVLIRPDFFSIFLSVRCSIDGPRMSEVVLHPAARTRVFLCLVGRVCVDFRVFSCIVLRHGTQ